MARKTGVGAARVEDPAELLGGLNPEQAEVVAHHTGPLLVGAVAGCGKTTVLVRRIGYLVLRHEVDPARILALTFSKKASEEMNLRLTRILGAGSGARVGTFHSLAMQFIREELPVVAKWDVDDRDDFRICIKDALGFRGMKWESADLTLVSSFISVCKARCALPGSPEALAYARELYARSPAGNREPSLLAEAYVRAEQLRRERRLMTFDDMLLEMWSALGDPTIRARWAARWDFVMQDEAQDENRVQREIAGYLAHGHRNYMVVGDPAQAIYGFRGSDPSGLIAFEGEWEARKILMERNYRCGLAIAEAANGSLRAMAPGTHLGMQIRAERSALGVVESAVHEDADAEADSVVRRIRELNADGVRWRDVVVLFRTNAQSRAMEEAALSERIPYQILGGTNFYERREVKDLLAYLRLAAGKGSFDDVRRCINAPFRYIGKAFVDRIADAAGVDVHDRRRSASRRDGGSPEWTSVVRSVIDGAGLQDRQRTAAREWCALVDEMAARISAGRDRAAASLRASVKDQLEGAAAQTAAAEEELNPSTPERVLEDILLATDYVRFLTRDEGSESPENNRVSNVRELVRASRRFGTVDSLLEYIEETIDAARRAKAGEEEGVDRVTMMSIHRSKGLEYRAVFVIGVNEGILPHGRCEDPNEERRLFYVAATRAKDLLSMTCVRRAALGSKTRELSPSRFLAEAGISVVEVAPPASVGESVGEMAAALGASVGG